jgi:hypothetical protein
MDQPETPPRSVYLDGYVRKPDDQRRLNELAAALWESPAGREYMQYLRSITVNAVCGPEISDAGLRHREGARALVALMNQQVEAHHREQQRNTRPDPSDADPHSRAHLAGTRPRSRVQRRLDPDPA